jgi:hypothetical protein
MTHRMRKACLLMACTLLVGFVSSSASADHALYRCLDNQLLRVSVDLVAERSLSFMNRHHHRRSMPLESRLTCFGSPRANGAA